MNTRVLQVKCFRPNPEFRQRCDCYPLQSCVYATNRATSRRTASFLALGLLALGVSWAHSQTATTRAPQSSPYSSIKSFKIVQEKDGPAVEILSTKPLIPSIQAIDDPPRLVIDLPHARLDTREKRIRVQADQISTLRADQFQQNPPVARVVVDLLVPRAYT